MPTTQDEETLLLNENLLLKLKRFDQNKIALTNLFSDSPQALRTNIPHQLKLIHQFYLEEFAKATSEFMQDCVIDDYSVFVNIAQQVRAGQLTSAEAIAKINESAQSEKIQIILNNILKLGELLFYATIVLACCSACITIGLPMLCTEPFSGLAINFAAYALILIMLNKIVDCFLEFESFDKINDLSEREKMTILFFSPDKSDNLDRITPQEGQLSLLQPI